MTRHVKTLLGVAAVASWLGQPVPAQIGKAKQKPQVRVDLVPAVEAVAAGKPFDVAIRFGLPDGWHMYWQNSGDSGQPPKIAWSLPAGFTAGPIQFPLPRRHVSAGKLVTNILEGNPVLLARITPPAGLTGERVSIGGTVRYLICREFCVRGDAELSCELPVAPAAGEVKTANDTLFRRARKALPSLTSKYLSVSGGVTPAALAPGKKFELSLSVNIQRGFHIQSHTPSRDSFIACDVFLDRADGVNFGPPVYPPPHMRTVKYLGQLSEYQGRITIRIPGEVDGEAESVPEGLGGILKYQACNDMGTCFPPSGLAFSVKLAAGGTTRFGAAPGTSPSQSHPSEPAAPRGDAERLALSTETPAAGTVGVGSRPSRSAAAQTDSDASPSFSAEQPVGPKAEADGGAVDEGDALMAFLRRFGTVGLLIGCFMYGLFINATPCVLPLLSIKVLGFVQQAHESRRRTLFLGLSFGAGVLIFFVVLGFLATRGQNLLQHTAAVIALSAVVLALALSMLGVYTLQVPTTASKLDARIQQEGMAASFGKGALAPVLGFACVGPLLVGAFGWATQQPPQLAFVAFLMMGVGMASPYVLLGANPNWLSFLPKPGNWMITFERIMGFLLLGMVIWLLQPVAIRTGAEGLEWTLGFFVVIAMACWMVGRIDMSMSAVRRWNYRGAAAAMVLLSGIAVYGWASPFQNAPGREAQ
ncbi:MAG: protein-disulfide reductase DsbD family protein, partial [Phycisphaerae bacterium]